jgi:hypothetical protein
MSLGRVNLSISKTIQITTTFFWMTMFYSFFPRNMAYFHRNQYLKNTNHLEKRIPIRKTFTLSFRPSPFFFIGSSLENPCQTSQHRDYSTSSTSTTTHSTARSTIFHKKRKRRQHLVMYSNKENYYEETTEEIHPIQPQPQPQNHADFDLMEYSYPSKHSKKDKKKIKNTKQSKHSKKENKKSNSNTNFNSPPTLDSDPYNPYNSYDSYNPYQSATATATTTTPQHPHSSSSKYLPRSKNQKLYVSYLSDPSVQIVIVYGSAGTGKTLFACQEAIRQLKSKEIDKIILTRPLISVDKEDIGFLPGTLESKMDPWTRPLFDILLEQFTKHELNHMIEKRTLEIAPLAYMRGRTFKRAFIIADEMQNSSPTQMLMMLTRLGEGTKLVVTGDLLQSDRPNEPNSIHASSSSRHMNTICTTTNGLYDFIEKVKSYRSYLREVSEACEVDYSILSNTSTSTSAYTSASASASASTSASTSSQVSPLSKRNSIEMIEMKTKDVERSDIVKKVLQIYGGKTSIYEIPPIFHCNP